MKKQFLFGMAAVAALCSCSNNEVMEAPESLQTPIAFGAYVGNSVNSRASVITNADGSLRGTPSNDTKNQAGFGVFGYYTSQTPYNAGTDQPNYMYNEKVTWNASVWEYEITKYWPNNPNDKLSFFAYAPYDKGSGNNFTFAPNNSGSSMTSPKIKFTVNKAVKEQQDLLWAAQTNLTKQGVAIPEEDPETNATIKPVHFSFEHALAKVGFKVEAMVDLVNSQETTGEAEDASLPNGTR